MGLAISETVEELCVGWKKWKEIIKCSNYILMAGNLLPTPTPLPCGCLLLDFILRNGDFEVAWKA